MDIGRLLGDILNEKNLSRLEIFYDTAHFSEDKFRDFFESYVHDVVLARQVINLNSYPKNSKSFKEYFRTFSKTEIENAIYGSHLLLLAIYTSEAYQCRHPEIHLNNDLFGYFDSFLEEVCYPAWNIDQLRIKYQEYFEVSPYPVKIKPLDCFLLKGSLDEVLIRTKIITYALHDLRFEMGAYDRT